ncbi:MAG TPA: DUF4145 domain-containing protein [Longimicrobium sp.]
MAGHKTKRLTAENWLEPDPVSTLLAVVDRRDGSVRPLAPEDYVQPALQPQLTSMVPEDVHDLFEVARGALAYGYYFYPLLTIAADQCVRVAEAAAKLKAEDLGCPKRISTFNDQIDWLVSAGAISTRDQEYWHGLRYLRNESSHPRCQHIFTPGIAFNTFHHVADLVNGLFGTAPSG